MIYMIHRIHIFGLIHIFGRLYIFRLCHLPPAAVQDRLQHCLFPSCLTSNRRRKLPTNERVNGCSKDADVCYSLSRIILTFVLKNDCFGIPRLHLQHLPVRAIATMLCAFTAVMVAGYLGIMVQFTREQIIYTCDLLKHTISSKNPFLLRSHIHLMRVLNRD